MPKPDRIGAWIFLLAFFLNSGKMWAQPIETPKTFPVRVAIRLVDMVTQKPVPYAAVRILGTNKGVTADSNGFFSLVLTQRDTLKISSLGYYEVLYVKNPQKQTSYYEMVPMKSKIFELGSVTIEAKREIDLNHPMLRWEYKQKFMPKLWLFHTPTGEPPPAPDISSPISFLYDRYSRRGKANRKLMDMVAERARKKRLSVKYNAAKVQRWTGLQDDEIDDFMRFCPMPDLFLEEASELEIIEKTYRCLEDFDNRENDR